MGATDETHLTRRHPFNGTVQHDWWYVLVGGAYVGKVRRNPDDGQWTAQAWDGTVSRTMMPLAGSWRTRAAAVLGAIDGHDDH